MRVAANKHLLLWSSLCTLLLLGFAAFRENVHQEWRQIQRTYREQLPESAAKEFKVFYQKQPVKGGSYSVDHGAGTFIIDRQGRLRLFAQYGAGAPALLHDIRILLQQP